MTDWREYAANGQWEKVNGWDIRSKGGRDLIDLRNMLRAIVPLVKRGHGVETFYDYAKAHELNDARWRAADLLEIVNNPTLPERGAYGDLCSDELGLAVSALARIGIEFEGLRETFIYSTAEGWGQLRQDIGAALCERRESLLEKSAGSVEEFCRLHASWHALYPWRRVLPLWRAWRSGYFEPNSPEDHALNLLDSYEKLHETLRRFLDDAGKKLHGGIGNRGHRAIDLLFLSKNAIAIGEHAEALRKKPFEPLAIARIRQKRAFAYQNEGRDIANAERKAAASAWKTLASQIAQESTLSGSAQARWVATQLERRHGIQKAPKTVSAALRLG